MRPTTVRPALSASASSSSSEVWMSQGAPGNSRPARSARSGSTVGCPRSGLAYDSSVSSPPRGHRRASRVPVHLELEALQTSQRLLQAIVGDRERDAEEPLASRTEPHARGNPDGDLVEDAQGEVDGLQAAGHRVPDVEAGLRRRRLDTDAAERG